MWTKNAWRHYTLCIWHLYSRLPALSLTLAALQGTQCIFIELSWFKKSLACAHPYQGEAQLLSIIVSKGFMWSSSCFQQSTFVKVWNQMVSVFKSPLFQAPSALICVCNPPCSVQIKKCICYLHLRAYGIRGSKS